MAKMINERNYAEVRCRGEGGRMGCVLHCLQWYAIDPHQGNNEQDCMYCRSLSFAYLPVSWHQTIRIFINYAIICRCLIFFATPSPVIPLRFHHFRSASLSVFIKHAVETTFLERCCCLSSIFSRIYAVLMQYVYSINERKYRGRC